MSFDGLPQARTASETPRIAWVVVHVAQVAAAFAVVDRSGASSSRKMLLILFGTIFWLRTLHGACRPLDAGFSWRDALLASVRTGTYQVGFSLLGVTSAAPLDALDHLGLALFAAGITLSLVSDWTLDRFHTRPRSVGGPCTSGPFAYVRHPKYLGDLLWASGWAMATRSIPAWLVVAGHAALLVLVHAPAVERRLAYRYGQAYLAWAGRTALLLPFIY